MKLVIKINQTSIEDWMVQSFFSFSTSIL